MISRIARSRTLTAALVALGVLVVSGYIIYESRRPPLDVAESRSVIEPPYEVVYEADFGKARLYLLKTDTEYETVWCNRDFLRWRGFEVQPVSRAGLGPALTAASGCFSLDGSPSVTFLAVEALDKCIHFIEAGPPDDRVKREVPTDGMVFFLWSDRRLQVDQLTPLALSEGGEVLYRYEIRAQDGVVSLPEDLKWWSSRDLAWSSSLDALSLEAKIAAGLNDPDPLVRQAWSMIQADIEQSEGSSKEIFKDQATRFIDAEIVTLELAGSFDNLEEDAVINVYLLQYRMLPQDPSKVFLPGGSTIQEGWKLSQGSQGDPYLVARSVNGEVTYLGTFHRGYGVLDGALEVLYRSEAGSFIATSPVEVGRVFALTLSDRTAREEASLFTKRFMRLLREEDDLSNPRHKTFIVTDYKDLGFDMYPTTDAPDEYQLNSSEVSEQSWIIEPSVAYRFEGTISGIGDGGSVPSDQWVTELYHGRRVGFLMKKEGDSYTFRSRYRPTGMN